MRLQVVPGWRQQGSSARLAGPAPPWRMKAESGRVRACIASLVGIQTTLARVPQAEFILLSQGEARTPRTPRISRLSADPRDLTKSLRLARPDINIEIRGAG